MRRSFIQWDCIQFSILKSYLNLFSCRLSVHIFCQVCHWGVTLLFIYFIYYMFIYLFIVGIFNYITFDKIELLTKNHCNAYWYFYILRKLAFSISIVSVFPTFFFFFLLVYGIFFPRKKYLYFYLVKFIGVLFWTSGILLRKVPLWRRPFCDRKIIQCFHGFYG